MSVESVASPSASVGGRRYRYDATGLLTACLDVNAAGWLFWSAGKVANEVNLHADGTERLTWLRAGGSPIAEILQGQGARTSLLAAGVSGSVILEADRDARSVAYSPYGDRDGDDTKRRKCALGFNSELQDAASAYYLLGPGHHRPYAPQLGIFLAPDRATPFGRGGLNGLSYCAGDPVNRTDPTGHFWKWVIAAVGVVVGVLAVAATAGAALTAISGVAAGVGLSKTGAAAIVSTTLGVAGASVDAGALVANAAGNEKAGGILGWVGLGLGAVALAGAVPTLFKAAVKGTSSIASKQTAFSSRVASVKHVSTKKGGTLMDDIIGLPSGARQDVTVKMMRSSGGSSGGSRASGSLYADASSESLATTRGYPRLEELSRRGQRNAMNNAQAHIRDNGFSENMFDFDRQGGLYNLIDRSYVRWDPTPVRAGRPPARPVPNVDEHLELAERVVAYNHRSPSGPPPPSYRRVMRQDAKDLPSYDSLFP